MNNSYVSMRCLCKYLLKKIVWILLGAVFFAGLVAEFQYTKALSSYNELQNNSYTETQEKLVENYDNLIKIFDTLNEYADQSLYYNLNPQEVYTANYICVGVREIDVYHIMKDESLMDYIGTTSYDSIDGKYIRELVSFEYDNGVLNIAVKADSKERAYGMVNAIDMYFADSKIEFAESKTAYDVIVDSELLDYKSGISQKIWEASEAITTAKKELASEGISTSENVAQKPHYSKKWLVLGFAAGFVLVMSVFVGIFSINGKVKSADEVVEMYSIEKLSTAKCSNDDLIRLVSYIQKKKSDIVFVIDTYLEDSFKDIDHLSFSEVDKMFSNEKSMNYVLVVTSLMTKYKDVDCVVENGKLSENNIMGYIYIND